jgi:dihydropteroate synthase
MSAAQAATPRRTLALRPGRPLVMGVLNVTPDSFSDGGRFLESAEAHAQAMTLIAAGADVVDIGGESTRPGAAALGEADELARVLPAIAAARAESAVAISIDTMKPVVARAAVEAGADVWNDVNALRAPGAPEEAVRLGVPVVLMHMKGEPRSMQDDPRYDDVVAEVIAFLRARVAAVEAAGVLPERIFVDPGVGFGKTLAHNLALIAALARIKAETGKPLVFGASRKRFVRALDPTAERADDRLGGSLAAALHAARSGADVIRVHDVRETVQALKMQAAIREAGDGAR